MPTLTVGDGKTYSAVQTAVNTIPANLVGGIYVVEVYTKAPSNNYDEVIDADAGFNSEDSTHYVHLQAQVRHNGIKGTGIKLRSGGAVSRQVTLGIYSRIEGFEVTQSSNYTVNTEILYGSTSGVTNTRIYDNFIYDITSSNNVTAISSRNDDGMVYNNIISNITLTSGLSAIGINCRMDSDGVFINHNTIVDCNNVGKDANSRNFVVIGASAVGSICKSNISLYTTTVSQLCFQYLAGATGLGNNCSSDATASGADGAGHLINQVPTDICTAPVTGDVTLKTGSNAIGAGVDTSGSTGSTQDIAQTSWGTPPSMGAFELVTISDTNIDSSAAQNPAITHGTPDVYLLNIGFTKAEPAKGDADVTQIDIDITGDIPAGGVSDVKVYTNSNPLFDGGEVLFGSDNNGGLGWGNGDTVSITGLVVPTVATLYFLIVFDIAFGTATKTVGCTVVNTTYFTSTDDVIDNGGLPATQGNITILGPPGGVPPINSRAILGSQLHNDFTSL